MIKDYMKIFKFLDFRERKNAFVLFGMMVTSGVFNAIGIASIIPFIGVASNPEFIRESEILQYIYNYGGFVSNQDFLIFLGAAFFLLFLTSVAQSFLTQYYVARFVHGRMFSFSSRLLKNYIYKKYDFFLNSHSAELSKSVLVEAERVVSGFLMPALQFISSLILSFFLVSLVIAVNPRVAFATALVLSTSYGLIYFFMKDLLHRLGAVRFKATQERFQIIQEGFAGIKEVKVLGLEKAIIERYKLATSKSTTSLSTLHVLGFFPKHALEIIMIGGVTFFTLFVLILQNHSISQILPELGVYALTSARLMPALQNMYGSLTKLRSNKIILDSLQAELTVEQSGETTELPSTSPKETVSLRNKIELKDIIFTYYEGGKPVLNNLNLLIHKNTTNAIVGPSGSGKSTLMDIMLGLLIPTQGGIIIDGKCLQEQYIRGWQLGLGYVPQSVFLIDDTISANIALGVDYNFVDQGAVERAAKMAHLHDFIVNDLTDGYNARVGDKGIRLSGGQRQRLAIARALYRDPEVLFFDEATSSLDSKTEQSVMEAIKGLSGSKTIIMITHRLETINFCDKIYHIQNGEIKEL